MTRENRYQVSQFAWL